LTPRAIQEGLIYDVTGDIDLFGRDGKAMSLVVEAYPVADPNKADVGHYNRRRLLNSRRNKGV
jgi:hypothetical protein